MPRIVVDSQMCKGCELCCRACPQGVLAPSRQINAKGYFPAAVANPGRCSGCRICAVVCPDVAIQVAVHGVRYEFFKY